MSDPCCRIIVASTIGISRLSIIQILFSVHQKFFLLAWILMSSSLFTYLERTLGIFFVWNLTVICCGQSQRKLIMDWGGACKLLFSCADWGLIWLQLNPIHNCCFLMLLDCWVCSVTEVGLYLCYEPKNFSQVQKNDRCLLFRVSQCCFLLIESVKISSLLFICSGQTKSNRIIVIWLRLYSTLNLMFPRIIFPSRN